MIHLQRGNWRVRDHIDERSTYWWRIAGVEAYVASPSIDDLVGSTMVLAGGLNDVVGWYAKALG
jgi:hypothetical protein